MPDRFLGKSTKQLFPEQKSVPCQYQKPGRPLLPSDPRKYRVLFIMSISYDHKRKSKSFFVNSSIHQFNTAKSERYLFSEYSLQQFSLFILCKTPDTQHFVLYFF